jgi:PAS domain S-box-containing protein
MTVQELIRAFAEASATAVCLTDVDLDRPGPTIRYVNPAFCAMTGFSLEEVVGRSPRILHGKSTNALALRALARALKAGEGFHGYLANYRKSGEEYISELDIRPVVDEESRVRFFIAFEREVRRRRGRPGSDPGSRYEPVDRRAVLPD